MKWDELQFVLQNASLFKHNNAYGGGDMSSDPNASSANPTAMLAPDIGMRRLRNFLVLVVLVLAIVYLIKHI